MACIRMPVQDRHAMKQALGRRFGDVSLYGVDRSRSPRSKEGCSRKGISEYSSPRTLPVLQLVGGRSPARPLASPRCGIDTLREKDAKTDGLDNVGGLRSMVISLERRADRMQACASRLEVHCPWLQHVPFAAVDGRVTPMSERDVVTSWHTGNNVTYQRKRSTRKGWDDLDSYQERTLAMSPGERGCAVSHIRIWERLVAEGGDQPLLVLEDDAAPTAEFTQRLSRAMAALPKDAHVLYLGYSQAADWRREVSADLVEAEYVWTTVAYIIWPAGARLLLSKLPVDQPVDNWMAAICASGELKSYCVLPKIVLQADAWNVNSDVGHSDEHYWGSCSDILHSDSLYWGDEDKRLRDAQPDTGNATSGNIPAQRTRSLFWDVGSDDSSSENNTDDEGMA